MPIPRRQFCSALGAAGLATVTGQVFAEHDQSVPLRVIAYNVYGGVGWPHNRPLTSKAVAKGQMVQRLAHALARYDPDLINFSESPGAAVTQEIAQHLGMYSVRFPSGGNWPGTLFSRFEIVDSANAPVVGGQRDPSQFTRHWGRGTIQLPNGQSLIVHSAHLNPTPDPLVRLSEVRTMLAAMKDDLDAGRSMLLLGDLNHNPETEEYQLWMDAGWVDTFAKVGQGRGPTIQADIPKWRIDYVMAAGPIAAQVTESRPLFEGDFRLNIADKQSFALSDHLPQLAVFGGSH